MGHYGGGKTNMTGMDVQSFKLSQEKAVNLLKEAYILKNNSQHSRIGQILWDLLPLELMSYYQDSPADFYYEECPSKVEELFWNNFVDGTK